MTRKMGLALIWLVLLIVSCSNPVIRTSALYNGSLVVVTDPETVSNRCGSIALGCIFRQHTILIAYSINNSAVLSHECRHLDSLHAGSSFAQEYLKDFISGLFLIEQIGMWFAGEVDFVRDCGKETVILK